MRWQVASCENAAMNPGMQGLDAAVKHFGKSCIVGDFGYGYAVFFKQFCCPAGRKDHHVHGNQFPGEIDDTCFIGYGDQGKSSHDRRNCSQ